MSGGNARSRATGIFAYAAVFILVLPALLALWAARLDRALALPSFRHPIAGWALFGLGVALALWATWSLKAQGGGMPMSPYPPSRRVASGPYRLLTHPLYAGYSLAAAGAAIALGSAAGLYIVVPFLLLAIAAFVLGYERDATLARIGPATRPPVLRLPAARDTAPTWEDRLSVVALVLAPWLVVYTAIIHVPVPDAVSTLTPWDERIPVLTWTETLYTATYLFVFLVPLLLPTQGQLRRFALRGWTATALVGSIQLLVPFVCPPKLVAGSGPLADWMRFERSLDAAAAALPAFHVVWALLAAAALAAAFPRARFAAWTLAIAISLSCLTTGMHSLLDVAAGGVAFGAVVAVPQIWSAIRAQAERLCNAWVEWAFGPLRLMNHSFFALLAVGPGLLVVAALTGGDMTGRLLAVAFATVLGGALWAQWLEGSSQLLRPYGYFGAIAGGILACVVIGLTLGSGMVLLAAFAVAAPLMHAIGRGRCLLQGCCHGAPAPPWLGICYRHPRSRVTRMTNLGGEPLHPTPVYSMASSLLTFAILLRMWTLHAHAEMLVGFYLVLTGIARFAEEHYRGEPQTKILAGLRIYQWLSIAFVVGGAALSVAGRTAMPAPAAPAPQALLAITAFALFAAAAYGADFPRASFRFARLT